MISRSESCIVATATAWSRRSRRGMAATRSAGPTSAGKGSRKGQGMAERKTKPTEVSVDDFIDAVPDPQRREDAKKVRAMMERVSGKPARMWGPTIIGFGQYHYEYASGHKGDMARIGFSPRAKELVFYIIPDIVPGFGRYQALMDRL